MCNLKSRLSFMVFNASTEFSELLLGSISLITGLWLLLPICHWAFRYWVTTSYMPEIWGVSLSVAGILKLYGVLCEIKKVRIASAFIATIVWVFLTVSWLNIEDQNIYRFYVLSAPITTVLAIYNAFIYIKLRMIHINGC